MVIKGSIALVRSTFIIQSNWFSPAEMNMPSGIPPAGEAVIRNVMALFVGSQVPVESIKAIFFAASMP